ncbi:MAG TPA: AraC family transcriptional regulator [Bacillota bacterium]|nr:AraC family transcriptional regulator [Bacillota bacterium]
MDNRHIGDVIATVHLETILLANIKNLIMTYERKIFKDMLRKNYQKCEQHLTQFCFELLELDEFEQVFIARIFFTSLVTDLMKKQVHKEQLQPKVLSHVFHAVATIDSLQNISEYLLYIPEFIENITQKIIGSHLLTESNEHVETILQLIGDHLTDPALSVQWLADQVNLSTTHVTNLFKQYMEQTVSEYIVNCRINEIAYELITTAKPMTEIYQTYGFVNQSHFIQRFKRAKGMTPLQYRKRFFNN